MLRLTSFTEMCGHGYFGVRVRPHPHKYRLHPGPQMSNDRRPWTSMDGRHPVYHQQCQQCTLFCHQLSAKGM